MKSRLLKLVGAGPAAPENTARDRRPRGLTALEKEFLPPVLEIQETPPSPVKRKVALAIIALVALLLVWSWFGKVDVVAMAPGKFIPDGKVKVIQPTANAVVRAIHVKEGQQVRQGDLLLELDPTISAADLAANTEKLTLNRLELIRLQAELKGATPAYDVPSQSRDMVALQEQLRQARRAAYGDKLAQANQAVEEKSAELAAAEATLKKLQETTAIAREREESGRPLVETGALSRLDYLQLKQDLVSNENELKAQTKTVEQLTHAWKEAEQKVAEVRHSDQASILADLDTHANDLAGLKGSVTKARQVYDLQWLKAPVDGLVQSVNVTTVGGVVTPAQPLVTIVPKGMPLIVEATLSNDDIGFVRVGQRAELKVDSFPFQQYGTIGGTLVWVSPDAEDTSNAASTPEDGSGQSARNSQNNGKNQKLTYKVHIRPDQLAMNVSGKAVPITPGMTLQADIVTDRRRVIEFFLSPVIKYLDQGIKVR